MTTRKAFYLFSAIMIFSSCHSLDNMMNETKAIEDILMKNTAAEEVRVVNFNNTNGVESATVEIIGSHPADFKTEAQRLDSLLYNRVEGFKKIDHFAVIFINKGIRTIIQFDGRKMTDQ